MLQISTVVPLYNCAKHIEDCLDSLVEQHIPEEEFEILVINDGSTDNGPEIVRKYVKKYSNIFLHNKENGGVSSARNYGVWHARGRYIHFMDADDILVKGGYSLLRICEQNADIVRFGNVTVDNRIDSDQIVNASLTAPRWLRYNNATEYVNKHGFPSFVWGCLYKRDYLRDSGIIMHDFKMCEDIVFNIELLCNIMPVRIVSFSGVIYKYMLRENSAMTNINKAHLQIAIQDILNAFGIVSFYSSKYPKLESAFDSVQSDFQRQLVTRLLAGSFHLSFISRILNEALLIGMFPTKNDNKSSRIINYIVSSPILLCIVSPLYRYLFIPFIKPYIKRN